MRYQQTIIKIYLSINPLLALIRNKRKKSMSIMLTYTFLIQKISCAALVNTEEHISIRHDEDGVSLYEQADNHSKIQIHDECKYDENEDAFSICNQSVLSNSDRAQTNKLDQNKNQYDGSGGQIRTIKPVPRYRYENEFTLFVPLAPIILPRKKQLSKFDSMIVFEGQGDISDFKITPTKEGMLDIEHKKSGKIHSMESFDRLEFEIGEKKINIVTKSLTPTDYTPEIFKTDKINLRNNKETVRFADFDARAEISKEINLSTTLPEIFELTADTSAPKMVPTSALMNEYFDRIKYLLQKLKRKQTGSNYMIVSSKLDESAYINDYNKGIKPEKDQYVVNDDCICLESIKCNNLILEAPFNIKFILPEDGGFGVRCLGQTIIHSYIPTVIKENCEFRTLITTLDFPKNRNGSEYNNTIFGSGNVFAGDFGSMAHSAPGVVVGNNNVLDDYYFGPDVRIGNGNICRSILVYSGSRIGNNCRIGKKVVIGQNVLIGDGVVIKDDVTIRDNVTIDKNCNIGYHVYIDENATIRKGVRLELGVVIGKRAIIKKTSTLSRCIAVGYDAVIEPSCYMRNGVKIGPKTTIENDCNFEKNISFYGTCGSFSMLKYKIDATGIIGKNCKLLRGILMKDSKLEEHVVLNDDVTLRENIMVASKIQICDHVVIGKNNIIGGVKNTYDDLYDLKLPNSIQDYRIRLVVINDKESD